MSGSTKLVTLVSIAVTIALGTLIWFVATVVAPALLPAPQSQPLPLIPVRPKPSLPAPSEASGHATATKPVHRPTPEPIANRWHFHADGSLELVPSEIHASHDSSNQTRSQP